MFFLLSLMALGEVPKKLPPAKERGENLYRALCWQCHGEKGKGDGPLASHMSKDLRDIAHNDIEQEKSYINIIQAGRGQMPSFEQVIDRHDSRRILLWLRDPVPQKKKDTENTDKKGKTGEKKEKK